MPAMPTISDAWVDECPNGSAWKPTRGTIPRASFRNLVVVRVQPLRVLSGSARELVARVPMAACCLVNHGNVVGGSFVVLHPAAVPYVELPALHVAPHLGVCFRRLLVPPAAEEGLLHDDKLAVGVLCQAGHDGVKDKLHCSNLTKGMWWWVRAGSRRT